MEQPLGHPQGGSVVIVTGAADGIGWAAAQRLARDHAHVVIVDVNREMALERAQELGEQHMGLAADVSSPEQVQAAVASVLERFGRIDVLVNNAGIGEQVGTTLTQNVASFDRVINVHVRGTFLVSQAVARGMVARGKGAIVNLGSIAGQAGIPARNAYGAAKAGILAMTRSMACEWGRRGVRVNAVAPGYVRTALVDDLSRQGVLDRDALVRRTPMGRMAEPEEVAEAIAFLASSRASFITGTTLNVDGGWLALGAPSETLLTEDVG